MTAATQSVTAGTGLSGNYVDSLDSFTGQERAKQQLRIKINSAKVDGTPLSHLMFASGYAGLGKTNLALICAAEMGVPLKVLPANIKPAEALQVIEQMPDRSIIFIDEAHRGVEGGKNKMDWLLQPMLNWVIETPFGIEEIPHVTFILATTDEGKLPEALVSRTTKITLERYTDIEAGDISVDISLGVIDEGMPEPTAHDCAAVARVANNNPRMIHNVWIAVRDAHRYDPKSVLAEVAEGTDQRRYKLDEVLHWWGLTHDGLTSEALRYLKIMFKHFPSGAGKTNINDAMHEPSGCAAVEQLLADKGFIAFTKAGRVLTPTGRKRVHAMEAELLV